MNMWRCPVCVGTGAVPLIDLISAYVPNSVSSFDPNLFTSEHGVCDLVVKSVQLCGAGGDCSIVFTFGFEQRKPHKLKAEEPEAANIRIQTLKDSDVKSVMTRETLGATSCPECPLKFQTSVHREFHVAAVHDKKLLCCSTSFASPELHLNHLKTAHGVTAFLCHLCPKAFKNKGTWTVHQRMFHGLRSGGSKRANSSAMADPVTGTPIQAVCSVCSEKMPDNSSCQEHRDLHNGKPLWPCSVCGKSFSTKAFLRNHVKLHTGETPYECKICNRTFTFKQSVAKHMLYHSEERPFKCDDCDKRFRESTTLQNHRRIHTGEKPFACDDCGKKFRQKVAWIVHRRIHTNEAPYVCPVCDRNFRYKVSLRSHRCKGGKRADSLSSPLSPNQRTAGLDGIMPKLETVEPEFGGQPAINIDTFVLREADRLLGLKIDDS